MPDRGLARRWAKTQAQDSQLENGSASRRVHYLSMEFLMGRALGKVPIVAEDLGLITPDVIELRDGCGFPGLKILQFVFGADGSYLAAHEHNIHWAMIRAASNSVANTAVFALQDVLGLDGSHRMNLPGSTEGTGA